MTRPTWCFLAAFVVAATSLCGFASAEIITVQLDGLDVSYDGTDITTTTSPDAIDAATVRVDGVLAGPIIFGPDLDLDLLIPSVTDLPAAGGSVTSAAGGFFDLEFPGGEFIELTLSEADVFFAPVPGIVQFVFAGTVGTIDGQMLPFGLEMGEPVTVSFSSQVSAGTLTTAFDPTLGFDVVTGFSADGTGEFRGALIPEPSTFGLMALFGLMSGSVAMRYRLG